MAEWNAPQAGQFHSAQREEKERRLSAVLYPDFMLPDFMQAG
jgi:hypothetical protein